MITFPNNSSLTEILEKIRPILPTDNLIFVVGGAVRDALLNRPIHDIDLVLTGDIRRITRKVADALNSPFYMLDAERDTARIIVYNGNTKRIFLDFAVMRGNDLQSDLLARDFTINAMAVDVHNPLKVIDPLKGANDLQKKLLRPCSPTTFIDDPVRILRAVRLAAEYELYLLPTTRQLIRHAVNLLPIISTERKRDELFRILDGLQPSAALQSLDILGVLPYLLPELMQLRGVTQSSPHLTDVWTHTFNVLSRLISLLNVLNPLTKSENTANWSLGLVSLRLGRFRTHLENHFNATLNPNRSIRALLLFAALYHDVGKPYTSQIEENGKISFINHEQIGEQLARERASQLRLSNQEIERLGLIVRNHMRPLLLGQAGEPPSRRAIYRFFRDCKEAGVDICLLSLADTLATYGSALPQQVWITQLDTIRVLLEGWWERSNEQIAPLPLINGDDLMQILNLPEGPLIGQLLEDLREMQASGDINNREQAEAYVRERLNKYTRYN